MWQSRENGGRLLKEQQKRLMVEQDVGSRAETCQELREKRKGGGQDQDDKDYLLLYYLSKGTYICIQHTHNTTHLVHKKLTPTLTTLCFGFVIEISISSAPELSLGEPDLKSMFSSSCFLRLSATVWMAFVHSSLREDRN